MTLHEQALRSAIPDLRDIPLDRLTKLGESVLANSIALYRQRLQDGGMPVYRFQSGITQPVPTEQEVSLDNDPSTAGGSLHGTR